MHALSRPHVSAAAGCGHAPSAPVGPSAASLLLPAPEGWGITRRGRVTDRALGPRVSTPLLRKMTGFSWPLWEGFLLSKPKPSRGSLQPLFVWEEGPSPSCGSQPFAPTAL